MLHAQSIQAELDKAEALKRQGNEAYTSGDLDTAIVSCAGAAAAAGASRHGTVPVGHLLPRPCRPFHWQKLYSEAVDAAPERARERAVYFANRAACHLKRGAHAEAAADCSAALEMQPHYLKALLRRSTAYEALDDLERALADAQRALEVRLFGLCVLSTWNGRLLLRAC